MIYNKYIFCLYGLFAMLMVSCDPKDAPHDTDHSQAGHENMIVLSEREKLLANITTDTAKIRTISESRTLTGTVAPDETTVNAISARVKGRIEQLHVRSIGESIRIGTPLYDIYSEELLSDESDYLTSLQQYRVTQTQKEIVSQLVDAAKKKLMSWSITDQQISELIRRGKPSGYMTFYSDKSGYVADLLVREGEYVEIGTPIIKTANLQTVWVEAQLYSDELTYLDSHEPIDIEAEALPDKIFRGEVVYSNPALEENGKINIVHIKINNHNALLKPGMMAYIYLKHNTKKALVVPKSSLLIEAAISVWVQNPDGMFEQRMVTIGTENKREVEILSGIKPGDVVVTSGAYLLKSEQSVKNSGGSMQGMKM